MLAVALDQAERIKQAVASSFAARDLYTEKQVAALVGLLRGEAERRTIKEEDCACFVLNNRILFIKGYWILCNRDGR